MGKADSESAHRCNKTICLPFSQEEYNAVINNAMDFRACVDQRIQLFPELFPPEIHMGYRMKDMYLSKKQGIAIRRIENSGTSYTIRPSFVMPYLTGIVDEVEKGIYLGKTQLDFHNILK